MRLRVLVFHDILSPDCLSDPSHMRPAAVKVRNMSDAGIDRIVRAIEPLAGAWWPRIQSTLLIGKQPINPPKG
jgi:hypothetical protein